MFEQHVISYFVISLFKSIQLKFKTQKSNSRENKENVPVLKVLRHYH